MTFEAPIIVRLSRKSKSRWDQSDVSAKVVSPGRPENSGSAHIRSASPHRIAQRSHLLSEFNNLHVYPVWHLPCLTTNVIARTTKEATHDKRSRARVFRSLRSVNTLTSFSARIAKRLEWLANFLTGDEKIAEACVVDACGQAESETPSLQEWLLQMGLDVHNPFRSASPATTDCSTFLRIHAMRLHSRRTHGLIL